MVIVTEVFVNLFYQVSILSCFLPEFICQFLSLLNLESGKGLNFYIKTKAQEMDRQLFQIVLHRGASKSINFFVFVLLKAPVFHNMHQSPSLTRIYISKFWIIITQIIKVTHWTSPRGQIWHNHVHYIYIMYNYICTSI